MLTKEIRAYSFLTALVICGLLGSLITAPKLIHYGVDFPFSVIVFSIFTYPIVDCICELWGKHVARQTLWLGLFCQILLTALIQLSIVAPHASYWHLQSAYQAVLSTGLNVAVASLLAFSVSQMIDIVVYQKIKEFSRGRWLWLRSNISVYLGQAVDSIIFVNIVFYASNQKLNILLGSITVKIILSFLMTPMVYLIVNGVNRYLDFKTLAFSVETPPTADPAGRLLSLAP
tara:strand:+ start:170 stop:862 length:693 start_codon:yes stop_codon:yes gene_type:complete